MDTCKEIAERQAETALANFGKDGELAPAILLFDQTQLMVCSILPVLNEENHGMPGAVARIGSVLGMLFQTRWMVLISETWIYETKSEDEVRGMRRGDLEKRAHGGDTTVQTGLLISAFDLQDLESSHTLTYNTEENFRRHDVAGIGEGDIADNVRWVADRLRTELAGRPEGQPPMYLVQLALDHLSDHVAAALVYGGVIESE